MRSRISSIVKTGFTGCGVTSEFPVTLLIASINPSGKFWFSAPASIRKNSAPVFDNCWVIVEGSDSVLNTERIAPGIGPTKARPLMCLANTLVTSGFGTFPKRIKNKFR